MLPFKNNKLKKIVNVYQLKYKDGEAQGLGDFIRGCFCLNQITTLLKLDFEIDIKNHPISLFLKAKDNTTDTNPDTDTDTNPDTDTDTNPDTTQNPLNPIIGEPLNKKVDDEDEDENWRNEICHYKDYNYKSISSRISVTNPIFLNNYIDHLNSVNVETYYTYVTSFPVVDKLTNDGRNKILQYFTPNDELDQIINDNMKKLNLVPKNYCVIHIRSGNRYLLKNEALDYNNVNKIIYIIKKIISTTTTTKLSISNILLISDTNKIKVIIKKHLPNIKMRLNPITHFGHYPNDANDANGANDPDELIKIRSSLVDFFLMSKSNTIFSFSPYNWQSGFSKQCSNLFNIPYYHIHIDDQH
jgi:hypothetical protein